MEPNKKYTQEEIDADPELAAAGVIAGDDIPGGEDLGLGGAGLSEDEEDINERTD